MSSKSDIAPLFVTTICVSKSKHHIRRNLCSRNFMGAESVVLCMGFDDRINQN